MTTASWRLQSELFLTPKGDLIELLMSFTDSDREENMRRDIQGDLVGTGLKIALVASRFNNFITSKLLDGALDCLKRHGVAEDDISVVWTPGSFELPLVAKRLAEAGGLDAIVCLGAVIRGGTPHFDFVASEAAKGIASVSLSTGVPTIFGVVTTDDLEQAIDRAGTRTGNRGAEAALSAIEMANLLKQLGE